MFLVVLLLWVCDGVWWLMIVGEYGGLVLEERRRATRTVREVSVVWDVVFVLLWYCIVYFKSYYFVWGRNDEWFGEWGWRVSVLTEVVRVVSIKVWSRIGSRICILFVVLKGRNCCVWLVIWLRICDVKY